MTTLAARSRGVIKSRTYGGGQANARGRLGRLPLDKLHAADAENADTFGETPGTVAALMYASGSGDRVPQDSSLSHVSTGSNYDSTENG